MRGGAIPMLVWGTILLVLAVGNWVWNGRAVGSGAASAAVLVIYGFGVTLWLARREAIRRGPPEPNAEPESVPQASVAAALLGISAGCALFGLAWARFLFDFGIALFIVAAARLAIELRAERTSRRQAIRSGVQTGEDKRP